MGARGVCFTSSRSRATLSRRYPIEGCFRFEPRARAARGFYVAWAPVVPALHQAGPGRPSHVDIHQGLPLSRARGSPRSRVLLAWQGTRSLNASQSRLRFLQRGRVFLGAAAARARVVGGVAGGRDSFASVPVGLRRDDGPPAVMWPLQSWWGPSVGVKGRFPAVNASGASTPESSPRRLINLRGGGDGGFLP
jgi:hypothetical protein